MNSEGNYGVKDKAEIIKNLTNKNKELRVGRRILMNLLEMTNEEKQTEIEKLKKENAQLRKKLNRMAQRIWAEKRNW